MAIDAADYFPKKSGEEFTDAGFLEGFVWIVVSHSLPAPEEGQCLRITGCPSQS
jgi:hypothetical protein